MQSLPDRARTTRWSRILPVVTTCLLGALALSETGLADASAPTATITETYELQALRGDSHFAWEAEFFGPGLDDGSSVNAGGVRAMAVWNDGSGPALYVGGGFVTAGPHHVNRIARWDGSAWTPLTGPNGTGVEMLDGGGLASVKALAVFEGDLIVAGFFDRAGGEEIDNIARWNGSEWSPLGPGLTGSIGVETLLEFDGALIAGGPFTQAGEETVDRIARWDGDQWSAVGGGVSGAEFNQTPRVYALAEFQGELVVGGNFLAAGELPVNRIARWNGSAWASVGSGVSDASNPSADLPSVRTLTAFDDDLIAGGNFTKAGGLDARLIARWDGTAWSPLGGGMDGSGNPTLSALTVYDGELIAGGIFTEADGATVNRVARWNGSAWSGLSGPAGTGTNGGISSFAVFDGELIAGSQGFSAAGGVIAHDIARWNGSEWSTLSGLAGTGVSGQVKATALFEGALIVGGTFAFAGGETVFNVARWDGQAWAPLSGPFGPGVLGLPGGGVTPSVNALAVFDGDLIAGGSFLDAGGVFVRHIARWDGTEWSPLGPEGAGIENTAGSPAVNALAVVDGALILGGRFTQAGGIAASNVARWDGSGWSALGPGLNDSVDALIDFDGALIAGGLFTAAGGQPVGRIARWDGSQWSALGSGLDDWVLALGLFEGDLIAAGGFTHAGGQPANRVARWDGTGWSPLGGGVNDRASALAVYDGALFVGGFFSQAGGGTATRIARWDGVEWSPLVGPAGEGMGGWFNPLVTALAAFDADGGGPEPEKLIAGGRFHLSGGVANWNLASYAPADAQSHLAVTPGHVAFGGVTVGNEAGPRLVTLSSLGNVAVQVSGIDAAAPPFSQADGSCPPLPFELAPTDSCTLSYGFAPTEVGDFEQAVTIATGAEPAVLTLAGEGIAQTPPAILIDPGSFSVVLSTGSTLDESLTIENAGDQVLEWELSPDCDLPGSVDWLDIAPASGNVAGGAAESVTVSFDAGGLAQGVYEALPCVASNDPDSPLVELPVTLTVIGTPPMLAVDPESLSATVEEGEAETRPLSLGNLGEQTLEWAVTDSGDTGEIPEFGTTVNALTVWDDGTGPALYAGGAITSELHGIGRWDGERWTALDTGFSNGAVLALTVFDGALIAGGTFTQANGVTVAKVARWDGSTWSPLGSGIAGGTTIRVNALTVFNGELIAGGSFTEAGGVTVNGIARWNGSEWAPLGSGLTTQVFALTVFDGALIAGGGFTQVGDQTFNRIARWDGSEWSPLGSGFDSSVLALTTFDGALIAGGSFGTAGGGPASRLAHWDGDQWSPLGAGVNTQVGALTVLDGDLIAGGLFSEAGGMPAANVARWDGGEWSPLGAGTSGRVSAVAAFGDSLIAGGTFTAAGGSPANRIARWDGSEWSPVITEIADCEPPTWLGADPAAGTVPGGDTQQVTVTFDAAELVAGVYEANLCLAGNDSLQPLTVVPLSLTVEVPVGDPVIDLDPESLSAVLGEEEMEIQLLTVANLGDAALDWQVTDGPDLFAVEQISAGGGHTCAIDAAGVAYCWGSNGDGQLGVGDTDDRNVPTPIDTTGLDGPVATISTGSSHTCAATATGSAYCWGRNSNGQLGVDDTNPRLTPTAVVAGGMGAVAEIANGWQHTCAVDSDGDAFCWGSNFFGQLGNGDAPIERHVPWPVDQEVLGTVAHIAAYGGHTCAVNDQAAGFCWGYNDDGNLGDGTTEQRRRPTPIDASQLVAVDHFSLSPFHTCAVDTAGAPYCWGSNSFGQLGDGTTTRRLVPTPVVTSDLLAAAQISTGEAHTCAVSTTGEGYCWGLNGSWQLGDGTAEDRHVPTRVHDDELGAVGAVSAGGAHSCAVTATGAAYCWGSNDLGQLGDGTTESRPFPTPVVSGGGGDCVLPGWLGVAPPGGSVPGGDEQLVDVTFDTTGLALGDYAANLCIASNDPAQPLTLVPATLTVAGAGVPELAFDPSSLDFGDVAVGTTSPPQSTTLHNAGDGDAIELSFNDISASGFDADASSCGTSLPAGATCEVVVTFTPPIEGPINPTLVASTPGVPPALLQLSGNGVIASPPSLDVDPESLSATLMQGAVETQTVTLSNLGDEDLEWIVPDLTQFGANVKALTIWDNGNGPALYVGGSDNTEFKGIARWDGVEWSLLGTGMNGDVEALTTFDGALIAAGGFTEAGGVTVNRVARWDGTQWSALGGGVGSTVYALTVYDGALIAGGLFTEAGGQAANRIARWDGNAWSPLGTGMDNRVGVLTVHDGALFAAGFFMEAGGVPATRIARWDGTQWSALGAGLDGGIVAALTVFDGELIASGRFTEAGGLPANRIASWDGSEWSPLGSGMPGTVTTNVNALTEFNGALIAGGRFSEAGGVSVANIARWDGSDWAALGTGLSGQVSAETVFGDALIAGGQFNFAGDIPTRGIAGWDGAAWSALVTEPSACDLPGWLEVDPTGGTVAGGDAQPVSVTFDATGVPLGEHQANLCLLSNDPEALLTLVPINLTVTAAPEADISPDGFTFALPQGGTAGDVLHIGNLGAAALEWSIGAVESDLVVFDDINFTVPPTQFGGSVRWDTGETCECQSLPFNFNMWKTNSDGNLAFFWPGQEAAGGGGVSLDGSTYAVLGAGATVGPHSDFIRLTATAATSGWRQATNVDGPLGFRFVHPDTGLVNYGFARITTTGIAGHPATVVSWVYDQAGNPIAVGGCTDPADIPWLAVDPLDGTTPPDGSVPVDVTVDTAGLEPGVHQEQFCVTTNDPAMPLAAIPVELTVLGDEPIVDVDPQAFELEVPQGGSGQEVLNVGNLGTADLEWSLDGAAGVQGGDTDVVADGGFEAGTPSSFWEEGSTNFGTPLCDADCGVNGAHSGSWWAWFGGIPNAAEIGFVTQEVTLPAADSAELRFWLMIADAFVAGQLEVSLDGEVLFSVTDADAGDFPIYTEVVLDVAAFADGAVHELAFHGETEAGPGVTSFFVDDVSLVVGSAGGCASPTDVPWLSAAPSAGTTPPDGNVPVDVVVDATGLELGMHQAQLCLTSNDPQTPLVEIPLTLNVTEGGIAELTFEPASVDFGDVEVGTSSPPQIATLENTGDVDLSGIAFTLPGEVYTADTSACGSDLPAGASCPVSVTFTPTTPGPAAAALETSSDQGASDILALSGNGVGAAKWFWQNPLPQGNLLHDVFFTDADHGTAVGAHGAIVRTTDGGITWVAQESGTTVQLNGVTFLDATHGHAVGAGGTILGTVDGGITWVRRTSGTPNDLHGIAFPDAEHGIAVGTGGTVLTTADGGGTWTPRASGTASELRDVSFTDVATGTAVGTSGTILRTTDGGATWTPQTSGTTNTLSAVAFTDAATGTAVGSGGRILRTTDGGATWVPQVSGVTSTLHEVAFADADHGWAVGFPSLILRTSDGGATWTPQPSGVINAILGISAISADSATAVGPVGAILHTTDGGETWVNQLPGPTDTLVGVSFPDPLTGTAVGNAGTILRTTDAGSHWLRQESGTTTALREVFFTATETGTAVGEQGLILRTTDGGESWEAQASGTTQTLRGVHFTGPDTGTVVGLGGTILTTADGGATWIARVSGTTQPLYAVSFADADHGMAVGEGGTVLKTTDGGVTWTPQSTGSTTNIYAGVSYVDPQTATVVGLNMFGTDSRIFRTTDGGSTWSEQEAGTSIPLNGVFFVDANRGTAVGGGGTILATVDGGETWVRDESRTTNILYSVHFTGADHGTAVGFGGTILRCCGAAGELSVAPDPLDFGEVPVGETGGPLSLTLTNTGTVDVTVSELSGPEAPFAPAGGTCDAVPFTLTPAASCALDFTFTPTAEGPAMSNMTIASDAPSGPHVATLQGIGTAEGAAELVFDPSGLDFGEVPIGETSPPQAATLENVGDTEATGLTFSPPGSGFDADTGACGDALPAGESCLISVTFTPIAPGPSSATLEVTGDQDAAASLGLSGHGVGGGGFTAMALEVDPDELSSDGNEVFEPGELVEVAPAWRNDGTTPQGLSGDASDLIGPDGAKYTLVLDEADYGTLDPDQTASCLETGVCYQVSVDDPAVRPAPHWEATFDETLSDDTFKTWTLHIGDSFVDVSRANLFYPSVETLLHHGITGGCTGSEYCPTASNTRDQMPVFVLRAVEGADYEPPACVEGAEVFHDVAAGNVFCPWIEELANRGVVSGCGGDNYCPNAPVTRAQMAIFLLRSLEGSDYEPPACTGLFVDVPCPSLFADWIEELFTRQITGGCSSQPLRYCPAHPVNREQMAAFIGKAFALTLYGP